MFVVSFYPLKLNFILAQVFLVGLAFVRPVLWANEQYTLSSQRLSKIIEAENRFFDLSKGAIKPATKNLPEKLRNRRFLRIISRRESTGYPCIDFVREVFGQSWATRSCR